MEFNQPMPCMVDGDLALVRYSAGAWYCVDLRYDTLLSRAIKKALAETQSVPGSAKVGQAA